MRLPKTNRATGFVVNEQKSKLASLTVDWKRTDKNMNEIILFYINLTSFSKQISKLFYFNTYTDNFYLKWNQKLASVTKLAET